MKMNCGVIAWLNQPGDVAALLHNLESQHHKPSVVIALYKNFSVRDIAEQTVNTDWNLIPIAIHELGTPLAIARVLRICNPHWLFFWSPAVEWTSLYIQTVVSQIAQYPDVHAIISPFQRINERGEYLGLDSDQEQLIHASRIDAFFSHASGQDVTFNLFSLSFNPLTFAQAWLDLETPDASGLPLLCESALLGGIAVSPMVNVFLRMPPSHRIPQHESRYLSDLHKRVITGQIGESQRETITALTAKYLLREIEELLAIGSYKEAQQKLMDFRSWRLPITRMRLSLACHYGRLIKTAS